MYLDPLIIALPTSTNLPELQNYDQLRANISWELDGLPEGKRLNVAHEAVDRRANGSRQDHVALRWLSKEGAIYDFTYGDLKNYVKWYRQLSGDTDCLIHYYRSLRR